MLLDVVEDLHVVADIAVGHVADDAQPVGIVRDLQRVVDRLQDVGAAVALDRLQELQRLRTFSGVLGTGAGKQG